ncbi:hypothetical protein SAMN05421848_0068 [Kushneria avicenniae]|uniref:Uncharacterized protein n=1 Tax=Kushneria avicenniae TaxID=402385 RepID=A0A1I1FC29_9GAMM|nr:hypothetical protein SAMN05421848_0068 [Kushneria avicenniae]
MNDASPQPCRPIQTFPDFYVGTGNIISFKRNAIS